MSVPRETALEWARQFAGLLESITGETAAANIAGTPPAGERLWWEQRLTAGSRAASCAIGVEPETCRLLGEAILQAAGIENPSAGDARRTCFEAVAEALAGVARILSGRFGTAIGCDGGAECGAAKHDGALDIFLEWGTRNFCGISVAVAPEIEELRAPPAAQARDVPAVSCAPNPAALDLLMDVELPVSISFGRTELPLQEVLRLAGGSVVELNRGATEPVDIAVNKSVIARGEVVVVDGNYGVRILEIATRQERLKSVD